LDHCGGNPAQIVAPGARRRGRQASIQIKIVMMKRVTIYAYRNDPAIVTRMYGDRGTDLERARQHEAMIEIGVLADQVDPSWGERDVMSVVTRVRRE
jgi:hypothetical protein